MNKRILTVLASANPQGSASTQLAHKALKYRGAEKPAIRDTGLGLPLIDANWIAASYTPADERTAKQQQLLQLSDQLIEELMTADEIVIATPMYNFSVPAGLKSWIDHITRVGVTFRYTEKGPEGLIGSKPVTLIVTTGGVPVDSEGDFLTPYLRHVLGFLGLTQVNLVAADQMNVSPEHSLQRAEEQLRQLGRSPRRAA
jgi:FMN-dependent NADH-azoreductase